MVSWKTALHACFERQINEMRNGVFDVRANTLHGNGSWNSFTCALALSLLHDYVDGLHLTFKTRIQFEPLEHIFRQSVLMLQFEPSVHGNKLHLFGLSRPAVDMAALSSDSATKPDKRVIQMQDLDKVVCLEIRMCVLLSGLALCQSALQPEYTRSFALMTKATISEIKVAKLHATNEFVKTVAVGFDGQELILDVVQAAHDTMAVRCLQQYPMYNRLLSEIDK